MITVKKIERNMKDVMLFPKRIMIHNVFKTYVVNLQEVLYLEADRSYTSIVMVNGLKLTSSKNLGYMEREVKYHPDFIRIHRTYVVNKSFVVAIERNKNRLFAHLVDKTIIEVSPKLRESIFKLLEY